MGIRSEEKFQQRLKKLASLSPSEKRKRAKEIDRRETQYAERHREQSKYISECRAFYASYLEEERED